MMDDKPWHVLERRTVYDSDRIRLHSLDIEMPDGSVEHNVHLVDYVREAAGVVPVGDDGRILLIEHYRFQTDTRAWEVPAGGIEDGENPTEAARRELREETGHSGREIIPLGRYHPSNGSSNQVFHLLLARGVARTGEIEDTNEILGLSWFTVDQVREMIIRNKIIDGLTLTGLLWYLLRLAGMTS